MRPSKRREKRKRGKRDELLSNKSRVMFKMYSPPQMTRYLSFYERDKLKMVVIEVLCNEGVNAYTVPRSHTGSPAWLWSCRGPASRTPPASAAPRGLSFARDRGKSRNEELVKRQTGVGRVQKAGWIFLIGDVHSSWQHLLNPFQKGI